MFGRAFSFLVLSFPHSSAGNHLINKIVSYKKVISRPNSVTLVEDLYPALEVLIGTKTLGILNVTNAGYVTHGDILTAYRKIVDPEHTYEAISLEELENNITKAKRSNCILSNKKALSLDIKLPALDKDRLHKILTTYKETLHKKIGK